MPSLLLADDGTIAIILRLLGRSRQWLQPFYFYNILYYDDEDDDDDCVLLARQKIE